MSIPVKPVQVKSVKPIAAAKPVQAVQQVQAVQKVSQAPVTSQDKKEDDGFDALFGTGVNKTEVTNKKPTEEKKETAKPKSKKASKGESAEKQDEKKKSYSGPRHIKVYGNTLFTEEDPNVTLEQIRERIVNEYGYEEFTESRTTMSLDEKTGIVVPIIQFQKKG